jgi:hypothetical protein
MSSYRHHFPQWLPNLFRFGWAIVPNLTKSFVLSAHSVEKRMQNIRTGSFRVFVMSDDVLDPAIARQFFQGGTRQPTVGSSERMSLLGSFL